MHFQEKAIFATQGWIQAQQGVTNAMKISNSSDATTGEMPTSKATTIMPPSMMLHSTTGEQKKTGGPVAGKNPSATGMTRKPATPAAIRARVAPGTTGTG